MVWWWWWWWWVALVPWWVPRLAGRGDWPKPAHTHKVAVCRCKGVRDVRAQVRKAGRRHLQRHSHVRGAEVGLECAAQLARGSWRQEERVLTRVDSEAAGGAASSGAAAEHHPVDAYVHRAR
eukprot:1647054-Pleurochrysis_carterae.AAC.1